MATKTKKQLISTIAEKVHKNANDVRIIIQAFLEEIVQSLSQGDRLEFRDFGVFEVVIRKQKIGRNPKNASIGIVIPQRRAVKFTVGKKFKQSVEKSQENKKEISIQTNVM